MGKLTVMFSSSSDDVQREVVLSLVASKITLALLPTQLRATTGNYAKRRPAYEPKSTIDTIIISIISYLNAVHNRTF